MIGKIDEHMPNLLAVQNSWKVPKKGGNNVDGGAPLSLVALATRRARVHNEAITEKRRSMKYKSSTYSALEGKAKSICLLKPNNRLYIVALARRMKSRIDFPDIAGPLACWAHVYTAEGDLVEIVIQCLAGCWAILVAMFRAVGIYM